MLFNFYRNFGKLMILCFISVFFISCKKEKSKVNIEGVTGYTWNVLMLTAKVPDLNTFYIVSFAGPAEFQLNDDQSFKLKVGSNESVGTYTWAAIDSIHANVAFTFKPGSGAGKFETVLSAVNTCEPSGFPSELTGISRPLYTKILYFKGSEGEFYIYR
ncbi:hypothetical protein [Pinibacter aurantiacus]|uniref:Uncharacterized protein n=1 Tax=Pinibacter aurantiacus TaxID=2851599 RepID=A0A9E2W8M2_9BACT|nr:hypothetical protein [Pinibacter aurantiacus]MBV4358382.1 hypothetical protein [Pinibacter aurantiacus]